ncbi:hypothetical protein IEQ34_010048 [Dendrobium chrysotoxum]|uniref:Uncharacterized protein n=1 Tax=Dendrobium chrysotoxum TaxID=161865 RepID=A0AAV7H4M6_DENCH|nr:hypothetical protein IEQ34_010048 [Dendrobium chrysotoxum]
MFLAMLRAQAILTSAIKHVNLTALFLINSSKNFGTTVVNDVVSLPKLWRSSSGSRPSGIRASKNTLMIEFCVDKSYAEATFDEAVRELHERNDMALCRIREYECMRGAHGYY